MEDIIGWDEMSVSVESATPRLAKILDGSALVFVVGAGRSGTTWVQSLLGSHPDVLACQESNIFSHFLGPCLKSWHTITQEGSDRKIGLQNYLTFDDFTRLLKEVFIRVLAEPIRELGDGQILVDKTPVHACWIPEIIELFPRARFVNVLRDARDVVASLLAASRGWGGSWAPAHPRDAALDWQQSVLGASEAIARFGREQIAEVRYEELLAQPHACLKFLLDFLKLPYDEQLIDRIVSSCHFRKVRYRGKSPGISLFGEMRRQNTDRREPDGFFRKGVAGSWKEDLSLFEKYFVWRYARKTMRTMGYPWALPL